MLVRVRAGRSVMISRLEALVALNLLPRIGPVRVRRLLEAFGDAASVLHAPVGQLLRVPGIGPDTAAVLAAWRDHADPAVELAEAARRGISVVTLEDPLYPAPLREAYDPPLLLYVWGGLRDRDRHAVGVVGSRRATIYGRHAARAFSYTLAQAGFTILSGMARGIDTAAHEAALAAGGRTVAVLGSGLARLYPPENQALAERIADGGGAVVSEFPLFTPPDKQTFPMRNRIVAAWSRAVLVAECPQWSGSLITANLANEYGKPVFAVPGPIDRASSAGCHQLIREGATLVTDAGQVLDDLGELPFSVPLHALPDPAGNPAGDPAATSAGPPASAVLPDGLPTEEANVLAALGADGSTVDQLVEQTGLSAAVCSSTLMKLEIRRLVRTMPGFRYVRRRAGGV